MGDRLTRRIHVSNGCILLAGAFGNNPVAPYALPLTTIVAITVLASVLNRMVIRRERQSHLPAVHAATLRDRDAAVNNATRF
jgi:hypothetical protein